MNDGWRHLTRNGGRIEPLNGGGWRLALAPADKGYAVAQIDDYGDGRRGRFNHWPGTMLRLRACFSHRAEQQPGTAGFGFWNAPLGDPTVNRPAWPQAAWFFLAAPNNDLPFAPPGGWGWFAATLDAGRPSARRVMPLAALFLLAHQFGPLRRRIWPWLQRRLGIAHTPLAGDPTGWHDYVLDWQPNGCRFLVDGEAILDTPLTPRGPVGFVVWIDNQYMIARPTGRVGAGVGAVQEGAWMAVEGVTIN